MSINSRIPHTSTSDLKLRPSRPSRIPPLHPFLPAVASEGCISEPLDPWQVGGERGGNRSRARSSPGKQQQQKQQGGVKRGEGKEPGGGVGSGGGRSRSSSPSWSRGAQPAWGPSPLGKVRKEEEEGGWSESGEGGQRKRGERGSGGGGGQQKVGESG